MEIIPVLDLMKGLVVHGVKGEREHYLPVESILDAGADPIEVARALQRETACYFLYIADLDAIQGVGDNRKVIKEIASHLDVDLWVDAGTADPESVEQLLAGGVDVVVIGSETLKSANQLRSICELIDKEQIIFSLDIAQGIVLSGALFLKGLEPIKALTLLTQMGLDRFILLTLDAVGSAGGPEVPLLQKAMLHFPLAAFFAGGGVKTPDHLLALSAMGISGVLVATSLHKGWITGRDIIALRQQGKGK